MKRDLKLIFGSVIAAVIIFGLLVTPPMQQVIQDSLPDDTLGRYVKTIVVGMLGEAGAAEADYQCNGTADNYWWQLALDALPPTGGKIIGLGGNYNFTATVSRAINNVTIEGLGRSSYFYNDASTPIFSAGSQTSWVFKEFATDEGWVTLADNTVVVNCWNEGILTNEVQGDVDYNGYMAIAMSCDQGATMPVVPQTGQWFLHTPTGRNILYQYNSAWVPIMSVGTTTLYVDAVGGATAGTDSLNYGWAAGNDAFATLAYAVSNAIPGLVGGNVYVYLSAETFSESVSIYGKTFTGAYGIYVYGTLTTSKSGTVDSGTTGTTSTQGTMTDTGELGSYDDMLLYVNSAYELIDTDTANIATIVGCFAAIPSGAYTIYNWGTTVTGITVTNGQQGVRLYDISVSGLGVSAFASVVGYRAKFGYFSVEAAYGNFELCHISRVADPVCSFQLNAAGYLTSCKVQALANVCCVRVFNGSQVSMRFGTLIDAYATGTGVWIRMMAGNDFWSTDTAGWCKIRNCTNAVDLDINSGAVNGAIVSHTGSISCDASSYEDFP